VRQWSFCRLALPLLVLLLLLLLLVLPLPLLLLLLQLQVMLCCPPHFHGRTCIHHAHQHSSSMQPGLDQLAHTRHMEQVLCPHAV
jgi:hypothetical protein